MLIRALASTAFLLFVFHGQYSWPQESASSISYRLGRGTFYLPKRQAGVRRTITIHESLETLPNLCFETPYKDPELCESKGWPKGDVPLRILETKNLTASGDRPAQRIHRVEYMYFYDRPPKGCVEGDDEFDLRSQQTYSKTGSPANKVLCGRYDEGWVPDSRIERVRNRKEIDPYLQRIKKLSSDEVIKSEDCPTQDQPKKPLPATQALIPKYDDVVVELAEKLGKCTLSHEESANVVGTLRGKNESQVYKDYFENRWKKLNPGSGLTIQGQKFSPEVLRAIDAVARTIYSEAAICQFPTKRIPVLPKPLTAAQKASYQKRGLPFPVPKMKYRTVFGYNPGHYEMVGTFLAQRHRACEEPEWAKNLSFMKGQPGRVDLMCGGKPANSNQAFEQILRQPAQFSCWRPIRGRNDQPIRFTLCPKISSNRDHWADPDQAWGSFNDDFWIAAMRIALEVVTDPAGFREEFQLKVGNQPLREPAFDYRHGSGFATHRSLPVNGIDSRPLKKTPSCNFQIYH